MASSNSVFAAAGTAYTWVGTTSDWTVSTNWSPNGIPTSADGVTIPTVTSPKVYPTITTGQIAAAKDLTIAAGATLNMTGGTFNFYHDWKNSGTFNGTGGTVQFKASGGGAPIWTGSNQFYNIGIDAAVDPKFSNGGTLSVSGNWIDSSTAVLGVGTAYTVIFNGSAGQTIKTLHGANNSFYNLTINNTNTVTLQNNLLIYGALTVKSGATLAMSTYTLGSPTSLTMETGATGASITGSGALTLGGDIAINSGSGANGASIGAPISLGAARTITVADDASASTDLTISGAISGAYAITKAGAGKMILSGANGYTGATNINAGTLALGAANRINNSSNLLLNGGTFNTGGYTDTLGTLAITDNSTIALGSGAHNLVFSNSSAVSWTSLKTLSVTGWAGTAGATGSDGKIFFGTSSSNLISGQLSKTSFNSYSGTPILLSTGELVPPAASTLSITTGSTAHGSSCVGVAATQITYTISNSAGTDVTGVTVTSNNADFVVSSAPTSVAANGTATYVVTFTPSSAGAKSATITISSTSPAGSLTSSLTGTGNALPSPTFTAQPSSPSCLNTDLTYTTQASQSDYVWTIPGVLNSDYSITSGGTLYDNTVTLKWLTAGNKSVSINYNNANGCTAASSVASNTIAVSVTSVAGTATGSTTICSGSTDISVSGYSGNIQWQSSTDNVSFSNVVSATSSTYTVSSPSVTTYFKAITGCNAAASNVVTIKKGVTGTWLGSTSNDWATAANWCGGIPGAATAVTIASGTSFQPTISGTTAALATTVSIGAGASLTLTSSGSSAFSGAITNAGNFNMSAGTVSVAGITNNKTFVLSGGSLTSSAAVNTSDSMLVSGGTLTSTAAAFTLVSGTLRQTGGTIWIGTAASNGGQELKLTAGTITQTGGTMYTKNYGPTAGTFNQNGANALFVCNHDWKPSSAHTFNSTSGTVQFIGAAGGAATFTSTTTQFNNVTVDASALTGFSTAASSVVKISGNYTNNQDSLITSATAANVSFTFNGSSNQSISSAAPAVNYATFGNATINNTGATVSLLSNASVVGNLTITSGILDLSSYTANRTASGGTISVAAGATLKIGGTNTFPTNYSTKTLNATSTVEYSGTTQTVAGLTYGHLVLSGGGAKTMPGSATSILGNFSLSGSGTSATGAAALTVSGNLSIGSGSTFTSGTFTHNLAGSWSNSGTFTAGAGTINFNGTTQSIDGSNPSSFYNLTINGGSNKTLSQPITIGNLLTLTSGYIISDATNKVIIADNANVSGASDASFVLGPIQKIGSTGLTDATFTFPSGKNSGSVYYEPVQIKFLATSSTMAFTVDHYTSVSMSGNLDVAVAANKDVSAKKMNYIPTDEYWNISNDEADGSKLSTSGVDVTIHYHNASVDLTTYKYILHHNGTLWEVPNKTNQTSFAGLNGGSAIKLPAQKSFSPFTIGGSASALPVTLMNFTAKATPERTAALNWSTESEALNKGFGIERQAGGVNGKYDRIGYVASKALNGNSQTALYYNYIDMHPGNGETVFYRLAQEDLDGKISFTEVRVVKFNNQTVSMIYPNPSTGLINISRTANGNKMNIQVTDMTGKLIQQINNVTDTNYKLNINLAGMYTVKLIYPETGEQTIQKIVIRK